MYRKDTINDNFLTMSDHFLTTLHFLTILDYKRNTSSFNTVSIKMGLGNSSICVLS